MRIERELPLPAIFASEGFFFQGRLSSDDDPQRAERTIDPALMSPTILLPSSMLTVRQTDMSAPTDSAPRNPNYTVKKVECVAAGTDVQARIFTQS
jgi:hypothetical protein